MFAELRAAGHGPGRHPGGARRRHHRLRQGHPEGRPRPPTWPWSRPWPTRESALHFYPDTDVIVDVGGQDIKLIILKNGQVKDFKLNTQCSAGNGYFLQSTADELRLRGRRLRRHRLQRASRCRCSATAAPSSCSRTSSTSSARAGRPRRSWPAWPPCCPRTSGCTWPRSRTWPRSGTNFVLQGGTQHNLAAVKSQVDFIESRFKGKGVQPEVIVHKHCGESGAIGARDRGRAPVRRTASADHVHRPRRGAGDHLRHAPQRGHALLLLQEQVPAHVHRRQRRPASDAEDCRASPRSRSCPASSA